MFLYNAISSWTAQSALHFSSPGRRVHSDTNSASPGSIIATLQLRAKTKSLTFPPLSIARYSFIQLCQLGRQWRERKCPIFETVAKGDSNPGSLDCESGILPLSYRALHVASYLNVFLIHIANKAIIDSTPSLAMMHVWRHNAFSIVTHVWRRLMAFFDGIFCPI